MLSTSSKRVAWLALLSGILMSSTLVQADDRHNSERPGETDVASPENVGGFGGKGVDNDNIQSKEELCQVSEDGIYGSSGTPQEVSYYYELNLKDGYEGTDQDIERDILPELERGFVNSIIPDLFPNECDGLSSGGRRHLTAQHRRTKVIGISSRALDQVLEGVDCEDPSSLCRVIDGEIRTFTDMNIAETKALALNNVTPQQIIEVLRMKAQEGAFNDLHPDVESVSILEGVPTSLMDGDSGDGADRDPPLQGGGDGSNNIALGVSMAVIAAILIAVAAVVYNRKRQRELDDEELEVHSTATPLGSGTAEDVPPSSVV